MPIGARTSPDRAVSPHRQYDVGVRKQPAGDFDYERFGRQYSTVRRPDPRIAALVRRALGSATSLINVGAGAGSYEPVDIEVTPVEPSAAMRSPRPRHLAPAIDAVAEDLPFPDDTFDAGLVSVTIHQWKDLCGGLSEIPPGHQRAGHHLDLRPHRRALADGTWDDKYGALRKAADYPGSLR